MSKPNINALATSVVDVYDTSGWLGQQRGIAALLAPHAVSYREEVSTAVDSLLAARHYAAGTITKLASERKILCDMADSFVVIVDAWPKARAEYCAGEVTTRGKNAGKRKARKMPDTAKARDMVLAAARAHRKKFGKDKLVGLVAESDAIALLVTAIADKAKAKPAGRGATEETCSVVALHDALAAFIADEKHAASTKQLRDMAKQLFDALPVEVVEEPAH